MFTNTLILLFLSFGSASLANSASLTRMQTPCFIMNCNTLYTPVTVSIDSCGCNATTHTYVYPPGYNHMEIEYNLSYPIQHDFFQNQALIGSCPTGLLCRQRFRLNPIYKLTSIITNFLDLLIQTNKSEDDDDYNLNLFTPLEMYQRSK